MARENAERREGVRKSWLARRRERKYAENLERQAERWRRVAVRADTPGQRAAAEGSAAVQRREAARWRRASKQERYPTGRRQGRGGQTR